MSTRSRSLCALSAMSASEEMTRSAIAIQASFRRRHVQIRARAQERGKALAQEQHVKRAEPTSFDAQLAAFQGAAVSQAVTHRIDFANAANGNPRPTAKHSSDAGHHDGDARNTSRTSVLRRPRATTRFSEHASAAAPAPTSTPASATTVSKLLRESEARPLQTLQEGAEVLASATLHSGATTTAANAAATGSAVASADVSAAAGAAQKELRRCYESEHAISVSEPESRMARRLGEVEAVTKQRGLASERDAEHGRHTQDQAQTMKAEREKLENERAQMAEQLAKLHEQSRRELTAWGDAQAADKGRLDALAAQLEGLRNERAALSMEREAMAQERKKLQKIRRQQEQQQQAANHGAENTENIPASVVHKRMQRQWAAQRQAFERLERLLQDATVKPPRRGSVAAAPGRIDGATTGVSVPTAHPRRRRRRTKQNRCKDVSSASISVADAASGGGSTGEGLRWRRVPLRRTVPPAMLFSPTSPCLQQARDDRSSDSVSSSVRPNSGRTDPKRRTSVGAFPEPEDFALRCARRAAAIQARLQGFDAATF